VRLVTNPSHGHSVIRIDVLTDRESITGMSEDWQQLVEGSEAEILTSPIGEQTLGLERIIGQFKN